ncbi:MAG TPA: prolipoprotein diacylglyceryl transferase [Spirochaetia bacterium]|nr:prolipoprotein diacylglyceryl transferase [Spirochaetia bacterium]
MLAFLNYPSWLSPDIIPGLPLRWYGLMYVVAFAISYLLFRYQVRQRKLDISDDEGVNLFFWGIVGVLLGGRIIGTTVYDPTHTYLTHPWLIFWPFDSQMHFIGLAGMSYHGGLAGAIIAIVIYCRVKKLDALELGDILIAGVPLGYTFGRLGNFINGELWGRATTVPWGMYFPHAERLSAKLDWVRKIAAKDGIHVTSPDQMLNLPRHPSQLYEALFEGVVLWLILWFVVRKHKPYKGFLIGAYIFGYGLIRFIIEYFREPDPGIGFPIKFAQHVLRAHPALLLNFTTGQILCFLMIVAAVAYWIVLGIRVKRNPEQFVPVADGGSVHRHAPAPQPVQHISARKLRKKIKD